MVLWSASLSLQPESHKAKDCVLTISLLNVWQVTDNGSYKLSNGIIILVEEDIQAYKEGTLVFDDANSEIM